MWQPLKQFEEVYEISHEGLVRRISTKRIIAITGRPYSRVHLCKNGIRTKPLLHRLVADQFISKLVANSVVNHKDGNPRNNHISNLEWVSQKENIRHSYDVLNRRNSQAKYVLNTQTGIYYDTVKEAALTTGYSYQSIRHKLSGRWPNNTSLIII